MKLFAVKSKTVHYKSTIDCNNGHQVHYDVYYPDNNVAKSTRPAPNFRVVVFEYENLFFKILNIQTLIVCR